MNKLIDKQKKLDMLDTYQKCIKELADDFTNGIINFKRHEQQKKELHKDIFGY